MKRFVKEQIRCFSRWLRRGYAVFASLHREVKIGVLSATMSILLPVTVLQARTAAIDSLATEREMQIESVGVTASKANPTRSTMSQTTLYDRKTDAAAPLQSFEAALRLMPSVDIRERGGRSSQADIAVRGGSFDQTMVMLNGINFTDARTGHQNHGLPIDMEAVAGMELIDGVAGAGAYAGAVNIRTQPLFDRYARAEVTAGQYGYLYTGLSGAFTTNRLTLFAAGSYRTSDGYRHNTDFRNYNAYVRMTFDSPRAGYFDFQAGGQGRRFGSNGFYAAYNPDQFEQTETFLASLRWVRTFGRFMMNASVSYRKNFDRYEWTRGTPMNYHTTDNVGAELWGEVRWAAGTTSLGGDYSFNGILSSNLGEALDTPRGRNGVYTCGKSRNVGNVWLRHVKSWRLFDISATGGASFTPYGTAALWSAAAAVKPTAGMRIEAGASQSMRLPTFTDLYYKTSAQINNLGLKPERAVTVRLDVSYLRNGWNAALHTYYRDGRDIIAWVWRDNLTVGDEHYTSVWHSEQQARMATYGVEVSGGYSRSKGVLRRVSASYGFIDSDERSDFKTSSVLDYMRHKAVLSVTLGFLRNFTFTATGSVYDRYGTYNEYLRDADGNLLRDENGVMQTVKRDFKPYFLLDCRLAWERGAFKVYVDVNNATDTRYCDFGGMTMPGVWATAGVVITLK